MPNFLIPHLAVRSLRGNRSKYLPFLLATSFMVFVYFLVASFTLNETFGRNIPDGDNIRQLMGVGFSLLPIVILPFLLYVNSYLIKSRSRELALYTVLGLEQRHIAGMLIIESTLCLLFCLIAGIGAGALLCPLVFGGLLAALRLPIDMQYSLSSEAILATIQVFGLCFVVMLIANIWRAVRTRPAALLRGDKQGERLLRGQPLIAATGLVCLIGGYGLSLTAAPDFGFLNRFLIAVLLVIIGTYGIFTAGSVSLLRRMRNDSRFFSDPSRFIIVSGLMHRMQKNAAGLVNICLFSTMALFTLCCSVCVLLGQNSAMGMIGQAIADGQIALNTADLTKEAIAMEFVTLSFLGIFFVLVFLACTALILYYKQLSESAEDLGRFRILRALGLSEEMTAATARRQLRVVFLLPLGTALLHILFASPILSIFLQILAIQDLWVPICGITFSMLFFTGMYTLFYHFTARAYTKAIS